MKVFVEEKSSGRFLTELGEWTADLGQAKDFQRTRLALEHCLGQKVFDVCLLLVFGLNRTLDVRVELFDRKGNGSIAGKASGGEGALALRTEASS